MCYCTPDIKTFKRLAEASGGGGDGHVEGTGTPVVKLIPVFRRLMGDMLTPVLAYRRLVAPDDRMAPSFLFESVVGGERVGRYSYLGARPDVQVIARGHDVQIIDAANPRNSRTYRSDDPLSEMGRLTRGWELVPVDGLPGFTGGWVGYAGYDTVRYLEGEKLSSPPPDDRNLPDLHMALYRQVVVFDHVQKTVLVITHAPVTVDTSAEAAYEAGRRELNDLVARVTTPRPAKGVARDGQAVELPVGEVDFTTAGRVDFSNVPKHLLEYKKPGSYQRAVEAAKQYIAAGDVFQVVLSQRREMRTAADPFDIYRALRVVNPSPYMFYIQIDGGMLVGSSPEILCRVQGGVVTSRPLAGTRPRGATADEDRELEAQLLADPKERAEHVMLVDLGRNDVGRVAQPDSVRLTQVMAVERYSHVMHISSTVTGRLADGLSCWDALRYTLPVGTVSGAPKVRAMQIIDELEPVRRGPYGGAVGFVDFAGNMDMAIALRTMVVMPADSLGGAAPVGNGPWAVHLQAGAGIVADSDPESEHRETCSKAAALAKAVELAEGAFDHPGG